MRDEGLQHALLVQPFSVSETVSFSSLAVAEVAPEGARNVRDAWPEDNLGEQVGTSADHFALEVPAVHASSGYVPRTGNDVEIARLLQLDELDQELGLPMIATD